MSTCVNSTVICLGPPSVNHYWLQGKPIYKNGRRIVPRYKSDKANMFIKQTKASGWDCRKLSKTHSSRDNGLSLLIRGAGFVT